MASEKGYNVAGDVLVNETADGVELQQIWQALQSALELYNTHRSTIVRLLSYPTTAVADVIPQSLDGESFEIATEFGVRQRYASLPTTCALATTFRTTTSDCRRRGNFFVAPRLNR
jgi:hypothetical protein